MRNLLNRVFANWQTTLAGLIGFVMTYLLYTGRITQDQFTTITALCASLGLVFTRDFAKKK